MAQVSTTHQRVSYESFLEFIAENPDLRTELTAEGELIALPPAAFDSGDQNSEVDFQLRAWTKKEGTGICVDSSTGFILPNGAIRSPDATWISKSRVSALPKGKRKGFLPLCPDFVIELRSKTDSLRSVKAKMAEYIANGAQLGWLIDPLKRTVHIYRSNLSVQVLDDPDEVSADPELPGFVLHLVPIFDPEY